MSSKEIKSSNVMKQATNERDMMIKQTKKYEGSHIIHEEISSIMEESLILDSKIEYIPNYSLPSNYVER